MRYIFHLSLPVTDLEESKRFYREVLRAVIGREHADWIDVLLWGHQITLQRRPQDVLPMDQQGKRHFGVVLPWSEWEQVAEQLKDRPDCMLGSPIVSGDSAQAKLYLQDPSNNVIEIKTYREPSRVLGLDDEGYA